MKKTNLSLLTLAALLLSTNIASAADAPSGKTREQVRAELAEAQQTGDLPAGGYFGGMKLNEVYPNRYPRVATAPGKTREQVRAELAEAQQTGDLPAGGYFGGKKLNELYPDRYPGLIKAGPSE